MATRSFTIQAEKTFGPEPSLVPLFVEALETGQRGGSDPEDVFKTTLLKSAPELVDRILDGWSKAPRERRARTPGGRPPAVRALEEDRPSEDGRPWEERVRARAVEYSAYHESIARYKRRLIKREVERALEDGVPNWAPSPEVRANKSVLYEATRAVWAEVAADCCRRSSAEGEPPARPRYGLRLSQIRCRDKDEWRHDEVYVVTVTVNGAGALKADTSPKYSMNDSDASVKWPNRFVFPPADNQGFLDVAVELREDDGGYAETAKAIAGLTAAVAAAGAAALNPWVIGAGVALGLVAGLVGIAGLVDKDDSYGHEGLSWLSDEDLEAGVGPYTMSFVNKDTGLFDFTQYNYDLQYDLVVTNGS